MLLTGLCLQIIWLHKNSRKLYEKCVCVHIPVCIFLNFGCWCQISNLRNVMALSQIFVLFLYRVVHMIYDAPLIAIWLISQSHWATKVNLNNQFRSLSFSSRTNMSIGSDSNNLPTQQRCQRQTKVFHHPFRAKAVFVYFLDSMYCSSVTTVFIQKSILLYFDRPFDENNNLVLHIQTFQTFSL